MKLFIDTNVLIDYTTEREPFTADARDIMDLCIGETAQGCIAAHSLLNMFFLLRKEFPDVSVRRAQLLDLTSFLDVIEVDKEIILKALRINVF